MSTYAGAVDICATAIRIIGLGLSCHGLTQVLTKLKEHLKNEKNYCIRETKLP